MSAFNTIIYVVLVHKRAFCLIKFKISTLMDVYDTIITSIRLSTNAKSARISTQEKGYSLSPPFRMCN